MPDVPVLPSGAERFTADDLEELSALVGDAWTSAADRDWSAQAGTVEWSCTATADHAVDCVYTAGVLPRLTPDGCLSKRRR